MVTKNVAIDLASAKNIALYSQLTPVLSSFLFKNIPTIVLKGAALAETIYPHIGLREISDFDLLLKPNDLKKSEDLLSSQGFTISPNNASIYWKNENVPTCIDLHTELKYLKKIDMRRLWQDAIPIRVADVDVLGLSPEDNLTYLISHLAYSHGYPYPKWLMDIDLLIRHYTKAINWNVVVQRLKMYEIEIAAYYVLIRTRKDFLTPIPSDVLHALKPNSKFNVQAKFFNSMMSLKKPLPFFDYIMPIFAQKGFVNKIALLFSSIFPDKETMINRYQMKRVWLLPFYYLYRFISLSGKALIALSQLILKLIKR